MAALLTAPGQHVLAAGCAHPLTEAVLFLARVLLGLVCSLHCVPPEGPKKRLLVNIESQATACQGVLSYPIYPQPYAQAKKRRNRRLRAVT